MSNLILKDVKKIYRHKDNHGNPLSILIRDGLIQKIESFSELERTINEKEMHETQIVDCKDLIALPGFVDSHTHLLFYGTREKELYMRAAGQSYLEILEQGGGIYNTVKAVRQASEEELLQNGLAFLDHALGFGITTVEIKSGYGLDFINEEKMLRVIQKLNDLHPVDIVPTFLVHTVPRDVDRKKYIEQVIHEMIPAFRQYSKWFDIFLEKGIFTVDEARVLLTHAQKHDYYLGMHVNQVHDIGGIPLAIDMGVRHVDHLEVLSDEDAENIKANRELFSVFLPSAEAYVFSSHVGQIHKLIQARDRIVISSDFNPGSSPVLSPLMVIAQALLRYRISDPSLLIDAFTLNPSRMLYMNDRGLLKEGMAADIQLFNVNSVEQIPYFSSFNLQRLIVKNGKVVYKI